MEQRVHENMSRVLFYTVWDAAQSFQFHVKVTVLKTEKIQKMYLVVYIFFCLDVHLFYY